MSTDGANDGDADGDSDGGGDGDVGGVVVAGCSALARIVMMVRVSRVDSAPWDNWESAEAKVNGRRDGDEDEGTLCLIG